MVEKGSALVGLLLGLLIVVGLAGASFAILSDGAGSKQQPGATAKGPAPSASSGPMDAAQLSVNGVELAQVQLAADAYGALHGMIPPDVAALVGAGELASTPHCAYAIDPGTGTVGYGPTQVDPTCGP